MNIRPATDGEVPILATAWHAMLAEVGLLAPEAPAAWREEVEAQFRRGMERGRQCWLVAEAEDGAIAGTGAAMVRRSTADLTVPVATLAGIYTFPDFRRRGVARGIVTALIEVARERGCRQVRLRASAAGRRLYESLGFMASDEMTLRLAKP
jgi:GNAT superfamily N-acetyltransferase